MSEGVEIAKGYVSVNPEISRAAFTGAGDIAGAAFTSAYTAEVRRGVANLQQSLRREAAQASNVGTELGSNLGKGISKGVTASNPEISRSFGGAAAAARAAASGISSSMDSASTAVQRLARTVGTTAFNMQLLGGALTRYITAPFAAGVGLMDKVGLGMATTIENAQVSLKAFLPVGADVEGLIARLKAESIASPIFDLGQILNFTKGLVGAGMEVSKAEQEVQALDKIFTTYGVTGAAVNDMLLGFSQVQSKGVAQSEELTKQISQQIPIWSLLEKVTGKSQAEIREMVKNKDITGEAFADLVIKMGELDSVQRGSAEGAKTLSAQWAMLKENMATALGAGFLANFPAIKKSLADIQPILFDLIGAFTSNIPNMIKFVGDLVQKIKDLKAAFDALTPDQKDLIERFAKGLVLAGPAILVLGQLTSGLGAMLQVVGLLINPMALMAVGIGLVAVGFAGLYKDSAKFREGIDAFVEAVRKGWDETIMPKVRDLVKYVREQMVPALNELVTSLGFTSWKDFGTFLGTTLITQLSLVITTVKTLAEDITKVAELLNKITGGGAKGLSQGEGAGQLSPQQPEASGLSKTLDWLGKNGAGEKTLSGLWNIQPWIQLLKAIGPVADGIKNVIGWLGTAGDAFGNFTSHAGTDMANWATNTGHWLRNASGAIDKWVLDTANSLGNWVSGIWDKITSWGSGVLGWFDSLGQSISGIWSGLWGGLTSKFDSLKDGILGAGDKIKDGMITAFHKMADGIETAFDRIRAIAAKPVNFVINDVYTKGIKKLVDEVGNVLHLGFSLPEVSPIPGYAAGGRIPGAPSSRDNTLAMVATGEYIMPTDRTAQYYPLLEAMRVGSLSGFADGGIVGSITGSFGWVADMAKDLALGPLVAAIRNNLGGMDSSSWADIPKQAGLQMLDSVLGYDTGGELTPGAPKLVRNNLGHSETVLPLPPGMVDRLLSSPNQGDMKIDLSIDLGEGIEEVYQIKRERNGRQQIQRLRAGRKR